MTRGALIVDVHALYENSVGLYGKVINYPALCKAINSLLLQRVAFGRQSYNKAKPFVNLLARNGFDVRFGLTSYVAKMALEVAELVRTTDHLYIAGGDPELKDMAAYAVQNGVPTTLIGFNFPEHPLYEVWNLTPEDNVFQERPNEVHGTSVRQDQPTAGSGDRTTVESVPTE